MSPPSPRRARRGRARHGRRARAARPAGTAPATDLSLLSSRTRSPRRGSLRRPERRRASRAARSQDEHRVAERVEPVLARDRLTVETPRLLDAGERHHEREQRRAWEVEVRQQGVKAVEFESGRDEEIGAALQRRAARERLEDANARRPDGDATRRRVDPRPFVQRDLVALSVQPVLGQVVDGDRTERVETDVERHARDVEAGQQLGREVQAGRRRRGRAGFARVDSLVPLGIVERLADVRREGRLPARRPVEPEPPPSFAQMLEQLDVAIAPPRAQAPGRPCKSLPDTVAVDPFQQQDLAARSLDQNPRRDDARVVDDGERVGDDVRQLCKRSVIDAPGHALVDQQSRLVAARLWSLRNQRRRKVVVEHIDPHPEPTLPLPRMDEAAVERAKERVERRTDAAALDAVLDRTRSQLEALAEAAEPAAAHLPERVEHAVQDALRDQVLPVGRNLAEIRGLMNQVLRRLDALEGTALADRDARLDDLALLVDLISSGWQGVDTRLERLEGVVG